MNSDSSAYIDDQYPDTLGSDVLTIALIGPDEGRRKAAATALAECQGGEIREFPTYPPSLDDVPKLLEQHFDVIMIDLDSHPEYALELVESICAKGTATVMIYSVKADSELLVRCMRAGAREFLTLPFAQNTMAEALVRATARRPAPRSPKKTGGRLLTFLGAKGGDGVTTLACNFAVSLAQESSQSTLLIDLDLPLGDAALNLGVVAEYSAINALQNAGRLDSSFLSKLLVKHSSGVSVLAAPGKFPQFDAPNESIDRLIMVARQDFDNVVIDMGSRLDLMGTSLFKDGSTVYLVIQAGIAGLRNSNRLISQYFSGSVPKLEIVLNRFEPRTMGVSEDQITKALTRPAQWKIPNDYSAVRRMQTTAVPLALEDSPISRLIRQMARTACGLPPAQEKRSGFSLKSLSRSISSKVVTEEVASSAFTQLGLGSSQDEDNSHSHATAYTPSEEPRHEERTQAPADRAESASAKRGVVQSISASRQSSEPETRTYKGSTYVKGADGEWHLQQSSASARVEEQPRVVEQPRAVEQPRVVEQPRAVEQPRVVEQPRAVEQPRVVEPPRPVEQPRVVEPPRAVEPPRPVEQEMTDIAWSTPAPITYGTPLGSKQLRALASAPGKFVYKPSLGEVLSTGTHTLTVDFTPNDGASFTKAQATVTLVVTKAMPVITWATPPAIIYGAEINATHLNATASVPGHFVYTPASGEVLPAGVHTLSVAFTPTDTVGYVATQSTVTITVAKAALAIAWQTPDSLVYGEALSAKQLNAKAPIPGSYSYTPPAGEVLPAGEHTLTVNFTPTDSTSYVMAQGTVRLKVAKATPSINWPTPSAIVYGTALSTSQLNASSSVSGKFAYIPGVGAVLGAGTHRPSVTFTPTDASNYVAVRAAVPLTVTKATPEITWQLPDSIVYGTALSASQLNATASVSGSFTYTPAAGEVLLEGTHTLTASFTPTDVTDYAATQTSVSLTVTKARPTPLTWPTPASISYGTALGSEQLNAAARVPGKFVYSPAAGEVLDAGMHTLSVIFTPTNSNFPAAEASVTLTVNKATPVITWPTPAVIAYGTALSAAQLNATASVPGSFAYSPAAGEVFAAGTHTLSVTFSPADIANVAKTQATVALTVSKATPVITWPTPAPISYGTELGATQLNATALVPGVFVYTPSVGTVLSAGTQRLSAIFTAKDTADYTSAQATVSLIVEELPNILSLMPEMDEADANRAHQAAVQRGTQTSGQQSKLETRTYKGAIYEKGADGQWYIQKK